MLKRSIVVSSPSTFNGVCEDVGLQSVVGLHSTVFPAVLGGIETGCVSHIRMGICIYTPILWV